MAQYPLIHAVIVLVVVIVVKQSFFDGRTPWLHVLYRHTYNTLSAETTTATASLKSKGDRDGLIKDLQSINQSINQNTFIQRHMSRVNQVRLQTPETSI